MIIGMFKKVNIVELLSDVQLLEIKVRVFYVDLVENKLGKLIDDLNFNKK